MIKYVKGNVCETQSKTVHLIVQCVNAKYKMGSGVAKAIMQKWPVVREIYMSKSSLELGSVHYVQVQNNIWVANLVGQPDVRSKELPVPIDYAAFRKGFEEVARFATDMESLNRTVSISMPRIGCGLAGGDWSTVEMIIQEKLKDFSVTVFDFDE